MAKRPRLFVPNDPQTAVINKELAKEIGLTQSVILMHLAHLISISENERDGKYWTYQSLSNLRDEYFPYWSKPTIGRAITDLVERDLLIVSNYNRSKIDRTPWYTLNLEALAKLASIRVAIEGEVPSSQFETSTSHSDTSTDQAETSTSHSETAIPETTSETTSEKREVQDEKEKDEPPVTQLERIREMTPEERLAYFEEEKSRINRLRGLS
jgi:hypothetical protein